MSDTIYTMNPPSVARLIYSSIVEKSAPPGTGAEPKFSATFGLEEKDFKDIVPLMVNAIKDEMGSWTGNPTDYYLACSSGETAAKRCLAKADLDASGKSADEVFKIKEKAEKRAALYRQFAGILVASSKFDFGRSRLEGGKIVDIGDDAHSLAAAGKDLFYGGAYVSFSIKLRAFRRKTLDAKDGVTAFLQNVLFVRKGERLAGGGASGNTVFGDYTNYSDIDPTAMAPSEDDAGGF